MDINRVMLLGRLGKDPELKATQAGQSVVRLSVATSEKPKDKEEKTEWHRVIAWDKTADACSKYLKKGSKVLIEGRLQTRQWEDKEKVKRETTEIVATNVTFLDPAPKSNGEPAVAATGEDNFPW